MIVHILSVQLSAYKAVDYITSFNRAGHLFTGCHSISFRELLLKCTKGHTDQFLHIMIDPQHAQAFEPKLLN